MWAELLMRERTAVVRATLVAVAGTALVLAPVPALTAAPAAGARPAGTTARKPDSARSAQAGARARAAGATRTLKATDTAHLRYVSASGSMLYEEGHATGTLPASMRVHFSVSATMSGSFTIYARGGTIVGHGQARLHGEGVYESFSGSLTATGGSGRFTRAHGSAKMYGTFDRDNYALVVQTVGTLYY